MVDREDAGMDNGEEVVNNEVINNDEVNNEELNKDIEVTEEDNAINGDF